MEDKSFTHVEKPAIIPEGWENQIPRRRIIVVDDDDDIRRFNTEALTGSSYHVKAAATAVPVILAFGVPHAEESKLRLAATLPKPFTLDQLLGTVKKVLGETDGGGWRAPASNQPPVAPWQV